MNFVTDSAYLESNAIKNINELIFQIFVIL